MNASRDSRVSGGSRQDGYSRSLVSTVRNRFGYVRAHARPLPRPDDAPTEVPPPGTRLLRLREVCLRYAVCPTTIRRATKSGSLRTYLTSGGHRRLSAVDVERWMGIEPTNGKESRPLIVGCVRVSTAKEEQATSIDRQREEIEQFARQEYGRGVDLWNERKASGLLFSHPKFLELVENMTSGAWRGGVVISTYADRLARQARELIEYLARLGGVEVRYIHKETPKDFAEQVADDILSYMTAVCNRNSGMKAKAVLECQISPECLKMFFLLVKSGYSQRYAEEEVFKAGHRDNKNGHRIHRNILAKRVRQNWDSLTALYEEESRKTKTTFHTFLEQRTRKTTERITVMAMTLTEAYAKWCRENKVEGISTHKQGKIMKDLGYVKCQTTGSKIAYRGLSLLQDK
jgi:excisionase family DNA binding protein